MKILVIADEESQKIWDFFRKEGIGDARKQALLKRFKSIENIKKASVAELCLVDGINEKIAEKILEKLN